MDIRDNVRLVLINDYLTKIKHEFERMYHNATIHDWPEVDDQEQFDLWLCDEVTFLCDWLDETINITSKMYSHGRSGATFAPVEYAEWCGRSVDVEDWAYTRELTFKKEDINHSSYFYCRLETTLSIVKEEHAAMKLINDTVIAAAANVGERWKERCNDYN